MRIKFSSYDKSVLFILVKNFVGTRALTNLKFLCFQNLILEKETQDKLCCMIFEYLIINFLSNHGGPNVIENLSKCDLPKTVIGEIFLFSKFQKKS